MQRHTTLPPPPRFAIDVVQELSAEPSGFLKYRSRKMCVVDSAGARSAPFVYDTIERECLDAVVVAPYFFASKAEGAQPEAYVVLRSAIRPPVALRDARVSPLSEKDNRGLWEFPAGLVEPEERSAAGLLRAASRELAEETGFVLPKEQLRPLGPSSFPCPGVIAERHFFFCVEVRPEERVTPSLDGSPLEEAGEVIALPLKSALIAASLGQLEDAKTELLLRRLVEVLG